MVKRGGFFPFQPFFYSSQQCGEWYANIIKLQRPHYAFANEGKGGQLFPLVAHFDTK